MACAFCATGEMGLVRDLSSGEIVDQVRHWQRELAVRGERVSHVVYMGMGEPLHNYEATLASARALIDPEGFGISPRRVTISTCGVVPGIDTAGIGSRESIVSPTGIRSSVDFSAMSHVTALPVYADIRPMIAVNVLSATVFNSLSGLPERTLSIRSVCSCT